MIYEECAEAARFEQQNKIKEKEALSSQRDIFDAATPRIPRRHNFVGIFTFLQRRSFCGHVRFMASTSVNLFRCGNSASAKLDNVRTRLSTPNSLRYDVDDFLAGGVIHVVAGSGGVSTFESATYLRGQWWRLAAGSRYNDSLLLVWNDKGQHWLWEPAHDMPLRQYVGELASMNAHFIFA